MYRIKAERHIRAPREKVWAVLKDFGGYHKIAPFVQFSPVTSRAKDGIGAEREIKFYDGSRMMQRIMACEEGKSMLISVFEPTFPVERALIDIELNDTPADTCLARFEIRYQPKFGWLGDILLGLMARFFLHARVNMVLRSIEREIRGSDLAAGAAA